MKAQDGCSTPHCAESATALVPIASSRKDARETLLQKEFIFPLEGYT
jgi:hypothetical protein